MKKGKIIALAKGVWAFCSFLYGAQWGGINYDKDEIRGLKNEVVN